MAIPGPNPFSHLDREKVLYNRLNPFWDDSYKKLTYVNEPFNDPETVKDWESKGFTGPYTGDLCDMRNMQPEWTKTITEWFARVGWEDIGTSFYRMKPGTVLPEHRDTYARYVELFNLQGKETSIRRAIVFLEDWQSGHIAEINGIMLTEYLAGSMAIWKYDTPHLAGNIGKTDRYTLQITGHIDENKFW